jgi:hypothetical protein
MNELPLVFEPAIRFAPGELLDIIARSYAELILGEPGIWDGERRNWEDFDRGVFDYPETVGSCAFVSRLGGEVAGLASYASSARTASCRITATGASAGAKSSRSSGASGKRDSAPRG